MSNEEKVMAENTVRINAAIAELQGTNSMLSARNMELAGEIAVLRARLKALEEKDKKE